MSVRKSETIGKLAEALAKAQHAMRVAIKDSVNPHFKSSYANLASVWEAVREPLSANGLAVIQSPTGKGREVVITTTLTHSSGEWLESDFSLTAQQDTPQAIVSAVTYGRRTALAAIAGIAPDDDDGESAQGRPAPHPAVAATKAAFPDAVEVPVISQSQESRDAAELAKVLSATFPDDSDDFCKEWVAKQLGLPKPVKGAFQKAPQKVRDRILKTAYELLQAAEEKRAAGMELPVWAGGSAVAP